MPHTVTNNGRRRIGVPVRQAFVLAVGETREITDKELAELESNNTAVRWIASGILSVRKGKASAKKAVEPDAPTKEEPEESPSDNLQDLPEGLTGEGIEYEVFGGGWCHLWVNGFRVTDKKVRKSEAEEMAADYE